MMNKLTLWRALFLILLTVICGYFAYQSWQHSIQFEQEIVTLNKQLSLTDNVKTTGKKALEWLTFSWYDGYSQQLADLQTQQADADNQQYLAHKYTKLFMASMVLLFLLAFMMPSVATLLALLAVTTVALVTGWLAPVLAIEAYQEVPVLGHTLFQFESKSIVSGIQKLAESGQWVIAGLIFIFTILTPIMKSAVMALILLSRRLHFSKRCITWLQLIGKWSMLDVFVIALLVIYFSTKAGGATDATLQIGVYYFIAYVLASMMLAFILSSRVYEHPSNTTNIS
ncbi:paraquat-inducible protein A [Marinicella gelatinilytica]|uniref:paraquat-inducible protein A n=1 Tax=Marinicella gelatinilytica TaxID=2996017 RepID=UPI002260E31B|nr:paraquat-inducible protein A [Marinicella gelatinilytica]MCX7544003.1 paraquat-inducible protein A [Marinicella gelatinilytica]